MEGEQRSMRYAPWLGVLVTVTIIALAASPIRAGSWTVNVPGLGNVRTEFGMAPGFDNQTGQPVGTYDNSLQEFIGWAAANYTDPSVETVDLNIRLTRPSGQVENWHQDSANLQTGTRVHFWHRFNFDGWPTGVYKIEFFINAVKIGAIELNRHN
jgi:hypothetical protein